MRTTLFNYDHSEIRLQARTGCCSLDSSAVITDLWNLGRRAKSWNLSLVDLSPVQRDTLLAERLTGLYLGRPERGPLTGGRSAALVRLRDYDIASYGRSRNFLDAPVSRLSPYLRHGNVSIIEVRDHIQTRYAGEHERLEEFLRQLAWRDYFEKVLDWYGEDIHEGLEDPKHGVRRHDVITLDLLEGNTGLPCMDGMLNELFTEGYLHNHERLWFAAYLCHYRGLSWKQGAKLFRQYLYDGDIASNSSSWQWVESVFASKPYFMNRENIERFSAGRWCSTCTVKCPFDQTYEVLERRLFGGGAAPNLDLRRVAKTSSDSVNHPAQAQMIEETTSRTHEALVWLHDAALSSEDPALKANPDAAVLFVFDEPSLRKEPWAFHRLAFVLDSVTDVFSNVNNPSKNVAVGDLAEQLRREAVRIGATTIHLTDHPNPWVRKTAEILKDDFTVVVHPRPQLTDYPDEPKRFSRYWDKMAPQVLGYKPKSKGRMHQ
jgi:deoxyribodipyrimidine photo-lyase